MTIEPEALEKLREKHRRWLSRLGIIDKPWLILGSAPSPHDSAGPDWTLRTR